MILYTAITNNKDTLKPYLGNDKAVCFTDSDLNIEGWEIRKIESSEPDLVRKMKIYKTCPHFFFDDDTIFVDGNITLKKTPTELFDFAFRDNDCDIAFFRHPWRNTLYEEAEYCLKHGDKLDKSSLIEEQVSYYRTDGIKGEDLVCGGIIIRRNTEKVRKFNSIWWNEICFGSKRDQISLPYVIEITGIKVKYLEKQVLFEDNTFYKREKHNW
jgi:hypothetical protein